MSNLLYINSNEELILEVLNFNYNSGADKYYPNIRWEMTARGETTEIGTGKCIRYTVDEEYEDEHVTFCAYIDEKDKNRYPQQKIECFVVKEAPKDLQVYAVKGTENASVGETVEFEVTEYNVDRKLREYEKDAIKWSVKIGDDDEKVFVDENGEPYQGEQISCVVPEEWGGEEVCVMPYFHSPTERNSQKVTVTEILGVYWIDDRENHYKLSQIEEGEKVTLCVKVKKGTAGKTVTIYINAEEGRCFEDGSVQKQYFDIPVQEDGIAYIEDFLVKYQNEK